MPPALYNDSKKQCDILHAALLLAFAINKANKNIPQNT